MIVNLKRKAKALIELLPWGSDLYRHYWVFPRAHDQVRGVFPDYSSALAAAGGAGQAEYDHNNAKKSFEKEQQIVDRYFQDSDYPALFWLSRTKVDAGKVLELGGSVGYAFYSFRRKMAFPESLRWTIIELPEAVRLGREIASARGEHQLSFSETIDYSSGYDVLLTAGTLQYMPERIADIIGAMAKPPPHLIINRVPAYEGDEFWTVQNLGVKSVPYRIFSRPKLVDSLLALGYELRDTWHKPRSMMIPFAPERTVTSYQGFYFERPNSPDCTCSRSF